MNLYWRKSTQVLQSPAIRAIALLPVLGYLIIFSSELSGWLNTSMVGDTFLIDPFTKIRMLYYGGVALFVALILHSLFCPETAKKFDNGALAMEEFWREGSARKAMLASQRLLFYMRSNRYHPQLLSNLGHIHLALYKTSVYDYLAKSGFSFSNAENEALSRFKNTQSRDKFQDDDISSMQGVLKKAFEQHSKNQTLIKESLGASIIRTEYEFDQVRIPWFRIPAGILSGVGVILIAIPATETFIHVLTVDFLMG